MKNENEVRPVDDFDLGVAIISLLYLVGGLGAFVVFYDSPSRPFLHVLIFSIVMMMSTFILMDFLTELKKK